MPSSQSSQHDRQYQQPFSLQESTTIKQPVTTGKVILTSLLVSLLTIGAFACGLIVFANARSSSQKAGYQSLLSDTEKQVREASSNVILSPSESARQAAISSTVNLVITSKAPSSEVAIDEGSIVQSPSSTSYGTGVLVSSDATKGYIVTSYALVQNSQSIKASVNVNGTDTTYDADIVGSDPLSDIAVLSVSAKNLTLAQVGDSSSVQQGDYVMSFGNSYGMETVMRSGMVRSLHRNYASDSISDNGIFADMIQSSIPIGNGDDGSGLYDSSGNLIGINLKLPDDLTSPSHQDEFGYAIPINQAATVVKDILSGKQPSHPSLGITLANVSDDDVASYGLKSKDGAKVSNVVPSGPAATAGIANDDIITSINGTQIKSSQDAVYAIRVLSINSQVEVKLLREGKSMTINVKVGSDV